MPIAPQVRMPMQIQMPPSHGSKVKTYWSILLSSNRSKLGSAGRIVAFDNRSANHLNLYQP